MKIYTKIYMDYFGYDTSDFICCEVCGSQAVDINHIVPRGMGGTKKPDEINNLMATCRKCHIDYADRKKYYEFLVYTHHNFMLTMGRKNGTK
jgi:hypothetical protein